MEDVECSKKFKPTPSSEEIKQAIQNTKTPLVFKNILSWDLLRWSLEDWVDKLGNPKLNFRIGTKQCTKMPQWESSCQVVSGTLKELLDDANTLTDTWMYFDYKHLKQHFKTETNLLETVSWADFGFPDKNGNDSTIWIGTEGAHTPCHMDSYGYNIVAQVYGRKLWVMFPPCKTSLLKPTRVPYEESSIYSNINFTCGLSDLQNVGEAHVVELSPGDVLVVPSHWWHYVENLTTAISINMWVPLETDHANRLQEALVRFFVSSTLRTFCMRAETSLLNPNEADLLDQPIDLQQISWCVDQVVAQKVSTKEDNSIPTTSYPGCVSTVSTMSAVDLQKFLLTKCGCVSDCTTKSSPAKSPPFSLEHVIDAFCHPDVIAKVAEMLLSIRKK